MTTAHLPPRASLAAPYCGWRFAHVAVLLVSVATTGCNSPSIVGVWEGVMPALDLPTVVTVFSDGTGDIAPQRLPRRPLTWRRVDGGYEILFPPDGKRMTATVREDGSLALQSPEHPELGLGVLSRTK
jgi:hypothetical protein